MSAAPTNPSPSRLARLRTTLETAAYAAAGAWLLMTLKIPAGALVGAMLAVAVASLCGRPTGAPSWLQTVCFIVVGAAVGAAATPDVFQSIGQWPASLMILAVSTVVMFAAGFGIFRRFGACDSTTAFYAAAPGAMSAVVIMAQDDGAVIQRVAAAQALRVAVVTAVSPLLLTAAHIHPGAPPPDGAHSLWAWALLIASSVGGWRLAVLMKWPSAAFLGPMAVSAALHASGLLTLSPPKAVILVASASLGAIVGSRFRGVRSSQLLSFVVPATASLLVMAAIGLAAGWGAGTISGVGPLAGMLAFAPGSMDVLIAISLAANQSPAYVALHHTVRLLAVLALMPLFRPRGDAAAT